MDGVDAALRPPLALVFKTSSDGREEAGPGEWAREEVMEGRGDDIADIAVCCGEMCRSSRRWDIRARSSALSGGLCFLFSR